MVMIIVAFILGVVMNYFFNGTIGLIFALAYVGYSMHRRRKEILALSLYLKQMNAGDPHYDISDYREGELSMLRSELSKTTFKLNAINQTLRDQQAFLYQSLSDISHQLKTPLTGMSLMNDILMEQVDAKSQLFVQESQIQVARLEWLVVSLLKLIQLEAKSIVLKKQAIMSYDLIQGALNHVDMNKDIILEGEDTLLHCDPEWTSEVLINILNNKNTYADSSLRLEVSHTRLNAFIKISDDGAPILLSEREKIFERFYKGAHARSNSVGIGLALSKEIMIQQGFKLYVEEENTFVLAFDDKTVTS